jgi:acid phosphatase
MRISKNFFYSITFLLLVLTFGCGSNESLINLDTAKNALREYYESGKYDAECKGIVDNAILQIEKLHFEKSSVVVFDIDDTALSGYEYTKSLGFGYFHKTWNEWVNDRKMKAVPQVKKFYDWLILRNIKVVFITGRKADIYEATKRNLIEQGYSKFDTLIVRSEIENGLPASQYKTSKRKELTERGYIIIANIGDQENDLSGDCSGIRIKLPNYLYLVD